VVTPSVPSLARILLLAASAPDVVGKYVREELELLEGTGLLLCPGCDAPINAKPENMQAFVAAAHEYGTMNSPWHVGSGPFTHQETASANGYPARPSRGVLFAGGVAANVSGPSLNPGNEHVGQAKRSLVKIAGFDFETACFGHGDAIVRHGAARFRQD